MSDVKLMDVRQVASYVGLSMHTVRKLVRDGALPAARIGRSYRFKADDIDSWIREQYHFMYPNKEKETQAKEAEAF